MKSFDKQLKRNIRHSIVKYARLHKKQLGTFLCSLSRTLSTDLLRHILREVVEPPAPRSLSIPIPVSSTVDVSDSEETNKSISVLVADGTNKNSRKNSTIPTMMPTLPIVRELICYVPTHRNVASRGDLIGIPYLGDKFDAEDQRLINSISIAPSKQHKSIRSNFHLSLSIECFSFLDFI